MTIDASARTVDCDLLVVGGGRGGARGRGHRRLPRARRRRRREGAGAGRGDVVVRRLDVGAAEPAVAGRRASSRTSTRPRTYLKHALGEHYDEPRVEALLENARHMVAFFEKHTALQFVSGTWIADIQGDLPGAGTGGRSVGPKPINERRVPKELRAMLRPQLYETSFLGMGIMAGPDLQAFLHATTSVEGFLHAAWRVAFHVFDLITHRRGMQLVNGPALIARLAKSADDLGVQLWVNAPATRLLTEDGAVTGAVVSAPAGEVHGPGAARGPARRRRVPATTSTRRRELFPRTPTGREHWTLAPPETDRRRHHARRVRGRRVRRRTWPSPAAWCPVSLVPYRNGRVGTYPHIVDRGKPGLIAVLSNGKRFVNEADGYYQFTAGDDRRGSRGRGGGGLADLRPRLPAPLPVRHGQAVPGPGVALPALGLPASAAGPWRTWPAALRDRPGRPAGDRRGVQRARPARRGPDVRPRQRPRSTAAPGTPSTARTRRWPRSRRARSTRSRCCPAASAPSPG